MARFTLHAVAADRPGIVAAITQSLADLGCNLEDSRMSVLRGQFSIVLVLEAPGLTNGTAIEEALAPLLETFALQLLICPIAEDLEALPLGDVVSVEVVGADHPGTVARIARAIAEAGGNIVDLVGHVAREDVQEPSRLQLTAELAHTSVAALQATLDALAAGLGMRCAVEEEAAEQTASSWP